MCVARSVWQDVIADVCVTDLLSRGIEISPTAIASASRGLIGETTFGVLPNITPTHTFALTGSFLLVYLTKLWFDPTYKRFLDSIVLSAMTSFLWGWHVHEKAVLLFLVPLRCVSSFFVVVAWRLICCGSLTAVEDNDHYRAYTVATCAGIYSLFPLLIHPAGLSRLSLFRYRF